jgi:hypothetical protein
MPEASKLALLRDDIDRNSHRLKSILTNAAMRREILKGIPDDEDKAVKAFVKQNQESALKTKPKVGFHFLSAQASPQPLSPASYPVPSSVSVEHQW